MAETGLNLVRDCFDLLSDAAGFRTLASAVLEQPLSSVVRRGRRPRSDTQLLALIEPSHRKVADDLCGADAIGQAAIEGCLNDPRVEEG